ncbi:MAG: aquaporin [Pseudomonadota bacterium]
MEADAGRRLVAEFVGTFALVFIGVGAIAVGAGLVGVAFAYGLVIAVMVSAAGHISGGHFNPAVTVGFLVTQRMAPILAGAYMATQLAAAAVAMLALRVIYPSAANLDAGVPTLNASVDVWGGALLEAILTFFLVWVVFATAADARGAFTSIAGLAIGLTITFGVLAGGPLTGAAMNPARAFGPELVQGIWSDAWLYYAGPIVGGGLAAVLYDWLYLRPLAPAPPGPPETGLDEPRPGDAAAR